MKTKYKMFKALIGPYGNRAILLFVASLLAAALEAISISMVMPMIDIFLQKEINPKFAIVEDILKYFEIEKGDRILAIFGIMLLVVTVKAVFILFQSYLNRTLVWRCANDWTSSLLRNHMTSTWLYFRGKKHGDMIHDILEIPVHTAVAFNKVNVLLVKLITAFFYIVVLMYSNWVMTLALLVIGAVIFLSLKSYMSKLFSSLGREKLVKYREVMSHVNESLNAFDEIKVYNLYDVLQKKIERSLEKLKSARVRIAFFSTATTPLNEVMVVLVGFLALWFAKSYLNIAIEEYISLIGLFLIIAQKSFSILSNAATQLMQIKSSAPYAYTLYKSLEAGTPSEDVNVSDRTAYSGDIILEGISYSYPEKENVLSDFNFTFKQGEVTALVGPSGSGKSTILRILLGFLIPDSGSVKVGKDFINEEDIANWRKQIGYVGQDINLFNSSVIENIKMGKPDATWEEVLESSRLAGLHETIEGFPEKYETVIGERGQLLSGGQRQRLSIARSLIAKNSVIIFDEATSALDVESESVIQDAIEKIKGKTTIILVTHKESSIREDYNLCRL